MKTIALRLYGKMDLRLEAFDLPDPGDDGIVAEVICDSLCMSSHKAAYQGSAHKRVPKNIDRDPIIIGHEFAGRLIHVGRRWKHRYQEGQKVTIQPALNTTASLERPGFSFPTLGGDSTHILIPSAIIEAGAVLDFRGGGYFMASLSEPMSCIIRACKSQYHIDQDTFEHRMGIRGGGRTALLASCGPMGLGLLDFLLNGPTNPAWVAVTDVIPARLDRAIRLLRPSEAQSRGIRLAYLNAADTQDIAHDLLELSGRHGYDDVFVLAAFPELIQLADRLLTEDGCINFFAGPNSPDFQAPINFYNVHYARTHVVGTSGGNIEDMREALDLISRGKINPAIMVTHIGGITAAREATLNLPNLPGGKKLIYTHLDLPLTAIEDFDQIGKQSFLFSELAEICARHSGLWNDEAEKFLLGNAPKVL